MSTFDDVNIDRLPAPDVIESLDFETALTEQRADLIDRAPELEAALALESEPLSKATESWAYRETHLRGRVNDAARALMLAFATGADLDHIGANPPYRLMRRVIQEADNTVFPPLPEILESDDAFRRRIQLRPEGFTSAGSIGAYTFHALNASVEVAAVSVVRPVPGTVRITVLGTSGDGAPSTETVNAVRNALSAEDVRPLCDTVVVEPAEILTYRIVATIAIGAGPDPAVVIAAAEAAAEQFAADNRSPGRDIALSGIYAALHQPGAQSVTLEVPAASIAVSPYQAAHCTEIVITAAEGE